MRAPLLLAPRTAYVVGIREVPRIGALCRGTSIRTRVICTTQGMGAWLLGAAWGSTDEPQ